MKKNKNNVEECAQCTQFCFLTLQFWLSYLVPTHLVPTYSVKTYCQLLLQFALNLLKIEFSINICQRAQSWKLPKELSILDQ